MFLRKAEFDITLPSSNLTIYHAQVYIYNYLFPLRAPKESSSAVSGTELTTLSAPGAVDKAASANQAWQELLKL